MELLFALFMNKNELIKIFSRHSKSSVKYFGVQTRNIFSLSLAATGATSVILNHELATNVPLILSPSKQQNREPLVLKPSHGGQETGALVLLLPSQIFPSIAEGNIVLCKNEGSLSAENPERINPERGREGSQRASASYGINAIRT
jgi:hypothetical protein